MEKNWKQLQFQVFWARLANFGKLGLVSDLISLQNLQTLAHWSQKAETYPLHCSEMYIYLTAAGAGATRTSTNCSKDK